MKYKRIKAAEYLISKGANVNSQNKVIIKIITQFLGKIINSF